MIILWIWWARNMVKELKLKIIELEKDALPFGNVGIFQVKEVNHTVNDKWETTIKLGFRPDNW